MSALLGEYAIEISEGNIEILDLKKLSNLPS